VADFVNQFSAFPAGSHDDMVDSSTQALNFLLFSSGGTTRIRPSESIQMVGEEIVGESAYDVYGGLY
jgi:hypothetical protein